MRRLKTALVIGSVRNGRFADKAASWFHDLAIARDELDVEVLDLRDFVLPFMEDAVPPAFGPAQDEHARLWREKIAAFDGYVFTAAEYNHGPTPVLKNALDHAYDEWNNKPVAFIGYGGVGGARAVEQLRLHAIELQMAPIRAAVHIAGADFGAVMSGSATLSDFEYLNESASNMLDQFVWWASALAVARDAQLSADRAA